jgi:hypothetical protein
MISEGGVEKSSLKKYIIARIELPVEIMSDGSFHTHTDRAQLDFLKCDQLPPIKDYQGIFLDDVVDTFFNQPTEDEPIFIVKTEPRPEPVPEPEPFTSPVSEPFTSPVSEPFTSPVSEPFENVLSKNEIDHFLSNYTDKKRTHSKNTSFRSYKNKRNHRMTAKKLDD